MESSQTEDGIKLVSDGQTEHVIITRAITCQQESCIYKINLRYLAPLFNSLTQCSSIIIELLTAV